MLGPTSSVGIFLGHAAPLFQLAFDFADRLVAQLAVQLECRIALRQQRESLF